MRSSWFMASESSLMLPIALNTCSKRPSTIFVTRLPVSRVPAARTWRKNRSSSPADGLTLTLDCLLVLNYLSDSGTLVTLLLVNTGTSWKLSRWTDLWFSGFCFLKSSIDIHKGRPFLSLAKVHLLYGVVDVVLIQGLFHFGYFCLLYL